MERMGEADPETLAQKKAERSQKAKEKREKLREDDPEKFAQKQAEAARKERERQARIRLAESERIRKGDLETLAQKKAERSRKAKEKREKLREDDPEKFAQKKAEAARKKRERQARNRLAESERIREGDLETLAQKKAERSQKAKEKREKLREDDPEKFAPKKAESARKERERQARIRQAESERIREEDLETLAQKKAERSRKAKEKQEKLREEDPEKFAQKKAEAARKERERQARIRQLKGRGGSLKTVGDSVQDLHGGQDIDHGPAVATRPVERTEVSENIKENGLKTPIISGTPTSVQISPFLRKRKEGPARKGDGTSPTTDGVSLEDQHVGRDRYHKPALGTRPVERTIMSENSQEDSNSCSRMPVPKESATPKTPTRMPPMSRNSCRRVLFPENDAVTGSKKTTEGNFAMQQQKYFENIRKGPTIICSCCAGLFYNKGIFKIYRLKLKEWKLSDDQISFILCVNQDPHWLCNTCKLTARDRKKVPALALSNGLDFPMIPAVLRDLTRLEQRLVSPRVPFMQIQLLGFEQQWKLCGNVVNVENDLNCCIKCLPRQFRESCVVQLKLMRRMHYSRPYIYEKIRPAVIVAAMKYLIETPLYKDDGVALSENWEFPVNLDEVDFKFDEDEENTPESSDGAQPPENEAVNEIIQDEEDNGVVDDEQTLLFQDDVAELGIKIAPAEGNRPLPLYKDPMAELLSFPKIYCGQPRKIKTGVKLSYTFTVRSELRRSDRRCATPEKILYSFKKLYNEKVRDAYQICLRQKPAAVGGKAVTAGMLKNDASVRNLLAKDDGYAVYKRVRCTPAYWKEQCKKVVAMIRQLGPCSLFITLSAAESRWGELLVILKRVVDNEHVREEDALRLPSKERARLVASDPVTCMRHFDNKYRELYSKLLKPDTGVFRPHGAEDWYSRIEYQMRGSPHSHGMYWLKDAPTYESCDNDSKLKCIEFIDKFITCKRDTEGDMKELIGYQLHRHSHTCKKGKRAVRCCRFHFPRPPPWNTMILDPLPSSTPGPDRDRLTEIYTKVETELNKLGRMYDGKMTIEEFLNKLSISSETYLDAIKTTIKRTTVFLKREPREAFVNAYNTDILLAWRANMDIQFVLDGYACAKYVATYISKSGGGVSKLLRAAAADVKDGNSRITNKLERFGSVLINSSEISAQEAAAFCLGMDLTSSSRSDVFANTGAANSRVKMTKPREELEKLADDSGDIYVKGAAERYSTRPEDMEHVCFAEFLAWWIPVVTSKKTSKEGPEECESIMIDDNMEEEAVEASMLESEAFETEKAKYKTREKAKILRFCNFSRVTSADDYWREQLMLFVLWRDEENNILEKGNFETEAKSKEDIILANSKEYYYTRKYATNLNDERVLINLEEVCEEVIAADDPPLPVDRGNLTREDDLIYTSETITGKTLKKIDMFLPPKQIENVKYYEVMRSLNELQRMFVLEVLHRLKTGGEPFHIFLSGGAGVGKSHVITAIVQSFLRFSNQLEEVNPESLPVIVCAPVGKGAFNVFGMTLHNVFRLPPMHYAGPLAPLEEGIANTLRVRYRETDLFIIDEISMCGSTMFQRIDARLRQLFNRSQPFGGKSILAVGHLRQLPPVGEAIIFKCSQLSGPEFARTPLVGRNPLWQKFRYYELTEIMRQRNAHAFCKALNNMSEGRMDAEDIQLIKSREVEESEAPKDAVWLFATNKECEEFNKNLHLSLGTKSVMSNALDTVTGNASDVEKRIFAAEARQFNRQENMGLLAYVNLQVGAIYFVTCNIDVADGLFNGATGILQGIEHGSSSSASISSLTAWIEFCHPSIGQNLRSLASHSARVNKLNFNKDWTPVDPISRILTRKRNGMQVTRNQVPVQAANGMTIAKSQGSSLPRVVITIKPRIRRENLYVACSRATNLEELYIVGDFVPPSFSDMSDPVSQEMKMLNESKLDFKLVFPEENSAQHKLYYHNVEGFIGHKLDILSDKNILAHDYLVFVEPRIKPTDSVALEGFRLCFRENSSLTKGRLTKEGPITTFCNSEGILVFRKGCDLGEETFELKTAKCNNSHCLLLSSQIEGKRFFFVYRHPKFPGRKFHKFLDDELRQHQADTITFIGDMNFDLKKTSNDYLLERFRALNLFPKLNPTTSTTNYNTHLDVCFSNDSNLGATVYENYYSYHKGLSVCW